MSKPTKAENTLKKKLIREWIAVDPDVTNVAISEKLGVNGSTVGLWRNDPKEIEATYERYMEIAGKELPLVITAMLEEAKLGNVRAAELVLKHFGKLQDTLVVKVEAPFMQHLKAVDRGDVEDAEIVEDFGPEVIGEGFEIPDRIVSQLPKRDPSNNHPLIKDKLDNKRVQQISAEALKRKRKGAKAKNERKQMNKRAKELGLEPMTGGRPSKSERSAWLAKLKNLEEEDAK